MMCKNNVPKRLWNYLLVWICESYNVTASGFICAYNRTPPLESYRWGYHILVHTSTLAFVIGYHFKQMWDLVKYI